MSELMPGRQDRRATLLGWALFLMFLLLMGNILILPRTALDERAALRAFHDSAGVLVMCLAAYVLIQRIKGPAPRPPAGLPENSFGFNRAILIALFTTFVVTGLIGFIYAWGEFDREVILFGITLPQVVAEGDGVRKPFGYLHSALSFYYLFLAGVWIVFGLYQKFRYRTGVLRLFPGSRV